MAIMWHDAQNRKMTLTLNIPIEIERHLTLKAQEQGRSTEIYILQILATSVSTQVKRNTLVDTLQSWLNEDDDGEQQETGEYLIHALDKDRLSDRQLFPAVT
jgi:predicted transcriptional regulator